MTYDGEGRRVRKVVGTEQTIYVYDAFGNLAAESGIAAGTGPMYATADALGSIRLLTDGNGVELRRYDYYPFGQDIARGTNGREELYPTGSAPDSPDVEPLKFTGKERDAETGLDYFGARYFSAAQGRFTSPDPVQMGLTRMADPQRWNLYSYARNNPLKFVDPDGMEVTVFTEIQKQGHTFVQIHNARHNVIFTYGRYAGGSSGSNARDLTLLAPAS